MRYYQKFHRNHMARTRPDANRIDEKCYLIISVLCPSHLFIRLKLSSATI